MAARPIVMTICFASSAICVAALCGGKGFDLHRGGMRGKLPGASTPGLMGAASYPNPKEPSAFLPEPPPPPLLVI